jgi:hypothetical protein
MKSLNLKIIFAAFSFLFVGLQAFSQQINDKDLKTNVSPLMGALNYITRLEPVKFEYNTKQFVQLNLPAGEQFGFIGEDVNQVLPALVSYKASNYQAGKNDSRIAKLKTVNLENYVPLLVSAIKEQQIQIEQLQKEVEILKAKASGK